jgi:hypothetical protein
MGPIWLATGLSLGTWRRQLWAGGGSPRLGLVGLMAKVVREGFEGGLVISALVARSA